MNILLTGYTGNFGLELARCLAPHRILALVREGAAVSPEPRVQLVGGSLEQLPAQLAPAVDLIVHSAALTAFRAPLAELRRVNVEGTAHLLDFARTCPRLRRFIHLSTTCVCGDLPGHIPEAPISSHPSFVNPYEQTKWEAEQVVLSSGLPVEIARLAIVAGSERDGFVRRLGALHQTLYWLYKGLIPMMPGCADATVDLVSTEFAAAAVAALTRAEVMPGRIVHVSAGERAPRLGELLGFLAGLFARYHRGWATGALVPPEMVDAQTFALFETSVRQSGDLLFQRVCDDAQSFLPGLLHIRTLATSLAAGQPLPDWRSLTERVFTSLLTGHWSRPKSQAVPPYACP